MDPVISGKGKKRQLSVIASDYSKCIICQVTNDQGPLYNLTKRGFTTFKNAVEIRKDEVYSRVWEDLLNEDLFLTKGPMCHEKCRSSYTLKRSLDNLASAKCFKRDQGETSGERKGRCSTDFKAVCFLCERERDSKGERTLTLVSTLNRQEAIHKKAKELRDETVLLKIGGHGEYCLDLIANDFRYHLRCMNNFMNRRSKAPEQICSSKSVTEYDKVFHILVSEISLELLINKNVYHFGQLSNRFRELLLQQGVVSKTPYKAERLKKRLFEHFGDAIQIVSLNSKEAYLCASSLTVKEFYDKKVSLRAESDLCELPNNEREEEPLLLNVSNSSYHVAKQLRAEVKRKGKESCESPVSKDIEISYEGASGQIPVDLYNHLAWLLTEEDYCLGDDEKVVLKKDEEERVLNVAQDIVGCISRQPLPKHVGLALHILKETRNKNLVTIMNKFGHCISYHTAQRHITTAANDVSEREEKEGLFIPKNITPGHFTQYAMDNLNFHTETADGGSFDATTNIIYQYTFDRNESEQVAGRVPLKKTRKYTISKPNKFVPVCSKLTLKDRRQARSLRDIELKRDEEEDCVLSDINIVWFLLRMYPTQMMISENNNHTGTLTWSSFFEYSSEQQTEKTKIGYGPLFPQNPTNAHVVKTSLDYFMSLSLKIGQGKTVLTCDQAIYDIVKGLVKKEPEKYRDVIVRLGRFHIAQNFLGSIGFLMKESGIEDILENSGICGRGTANKVMAGKDYYKMVRYHAWLSEAFFMLKWEAFEKWLLFEEKEDMLSLLSSLLDRLTNTFGNTEKDEFASLVEEVKTFLESLTPLWTEFEKGLGVTAHLWNMYIDMVLIFRRYIHAERAGLWQQHLQEVQNMLPYTITSGHTNYMSCLPIYLSEMKNLPKTAPEVYQEFIAGKFTVYQTAGHFNGVWTDLALEQTYNKEGKTSLFKGITQSESAREKYIKALPFMTSVSDSVKQMAHMALPQSDHHEKMKRDDLDFVLDIKRTIEEKMQNPFDPSFATDKLMNISTGQILATTTLVEAKRLGLEAMTAASTVNAEKIVHPKIETFATHMKKGKKKRDTVKEVIREESAVTRALCFAKDMSDEARTEAFSYEWLEYPPSLFQPEKSGFSMRKGCKSNYLYSIQEEVTGSWEPTTELPSSSSDAVYVVDAMAFIQRFNTLGSSTFGQLKERYRHKLLTMKPRSCTELHFVGDQYNFGLSSLKGDERQRRELNINLQEYVPADSMKIPDWKTFLSNPCNKTNLLKYLSLRWSQESWPDDFCLVLGVSAQTTSVRQKEHTNVEELNCSNHEEADTRIFAHIANCEENSKVVIQATDTDIVILSMYHYPRLANIEEIWVEKEDMFLPIHDLVNELAKRVGEDVLALTDTLLVSYVLSGCDSVSYPFKRGKKRAVKVALQYVNKLPTLTNYIRHESISELNQVITEARNFFCDLYGKSGYSSLDKLRAHLFASSNLDLRSLPPTEDAFHFHVLRSLCQISLYKQACLSNPVLLPLEEYGRSVNGDRLIPVMKSKPSKPVAAKLKYCKCKKSGCLRNCLCVRAGVPCIIACACNGDAEKCGRLMMIDENE